MAMAPRVESYLARHGAKYDLLAHPHSQSSIETADRANIPGDHLVKAVVLKDDDGMMLAVLPSTLSVHIGHLTTELERKFRLADEQELQGLFPDCEPGAVPPIGPAYGLRTLVDDSLDAREDVYFEAGDHEHVVHMTAVQFMQLLGNAERVHFGKAERHLQR